MNRIYSKFCGRVRHRLSGRQGATLVFAIAVFLVASIFSLVIVQESSARAVKAYESRDSEQAYLAIQSAANLLQDALKDGLKRNYTETTNDEAGEVEVTIENFETSLESNPDIFQKAFAKALDSGLTSSRLNLAVSGEYNIPDVTITLSRESTLDVRAKFTASTSTMTLLFDFIPTSANDLQSNGSSQYYLYKWNVTSS